MSKVHDVFSAAQQVVRECLVFESRGQGAGNRITNQAMIRINEIVAVKHGRQTVEQVLSPLNKQSVDFYFEDEKTIVEVEFSFSNPYPCLEKDSFKALLAREQGHPVERLVIIGDPGSLGRSSAAAPQAIMAWLKEHQQLQVDVMELMP
ncbi:MAG TPA: hypothetical protein PLG56_08170 [Lacunisphaera sp.]|nr:hypothetical protein [Lacunisphaera sp.]